MITVYLVLNKILHKILVVFPRPLARGGEKLDLSQALPGLHRDLRVPPAPPRPWDPLGQHYEPLPSEDHSRLHNGYNAGPPAHLTARANQLLKVRKV